MKITRRFYSDVLWFIGCLSLLFSLTSQVILTMRFVSSTHLWISITSLLIAVLFLQLSKDVKKAKDMLERKNYFKGLFFVSFVLIVVSIGSFLLIKEFLSRHAVVIAYVLVFMYCLLYQIGIFFMRLWLFRTKNGSSMVGKILRRLFKQNYKFYKIKRFFKNHKTNKMPEKKIPVYTLTVIEYEIAMTILNLLKSQKIRAALIHELEKGYELVLIPCTTKEENMMYATCKQYHYEPAEDRTNWKMVRDEKGLTLKRKKNQN